MKTCSVKVTAPTPVICSKHTDHSEPMTCQKCKDFFVKYIDIDRLELDQKSKAQSDSKLWHDTRKLRLTASSVKKVPVRDTTNPDNVLREHLFPSFRGNHATQHGKDCEPKALKELAELGHPTVKMGTVLSASEPWLSASPDGMIGEDFKVLVEVKCPLVTNESFTDSDMLEAGKSVCDVHIADGEPVLRRNGPRGYFLRLQIEMYCTEITNGKCFVWTKDAHVLLDIEYDVNYVKDVVQRLKRFYFGKMLPRSNV